MFDFKLPSLGADMDKGTLIEWKVVPGQAVHKGDVVAVVDTSKAAVDVEIWQPGVVTELKVQPGDRIQHLRLAQKAALREVVRLHAVFALQGAVFSPGGALKSRHALAGAAPAQFDQNVAGRDAILLLGALGEQQERAVHPGVAQGQGVAIDADRLVHQRYHQVLGHVLDAEHTDAGVDTHAITHSNEYFHWRITSTSAQTSSCSINTISAACCNKVL